MKLGEVLMKERERKKLSPEDMAGKLGIPVEKYQEIEEGRSEGETWGPLLARIAIKLETPTSRLLADSGRAADTRPGQAGELIRKHRERRSKTPEQMAELLEVSREEYERIETGQSPIEEYGPFFLRFAEVIEQPVFNLFYPFGLPLDRLSVEDYR
ncbi:MAG TPA: helix-turn-helix domain-containing protein [Thermoanaerobaculia bacterium]|nr:helix-turn-helix domain-containing protein [Thermoanaerobaculia bacterium]